MPRNLNRAPCWPKTVSTPSILRKHFADCKLGLKATLKEFAPQNLVPNHDETPSVVHFMRHAKV